MFFCSGAPKMPTTGFCPSTLALGVVVFAPLVELELLLLLPHPATTAARTATASTVRTIPPLRFVVIQMLLSPGRHRCPGPFPDRRNASCGCRRRPPPRPPRRRANAARTGLRSSLFVRSPPAHLRQPARLRLRAVPARPRSVPRVHPPRGGP